MRFHKFKADKLFTGTELLDANHVLICGENGQVEAVVDELNAGDDVQQLNGWLTPGFINCHCHLELSHMRGLIPEKTGLIDFVFKVVTQRHFGEEEIFEAVEIAESEMLQNGIVAVGDISNNNLTLRQKLKRNLQYYTFVEVSGWLPELAQIRYSRSKGYYDHFVTNLPNTSLVPHAPYSVSEELWQLLQRDFKNKVVSIHNQETAFEDELFLQNSGDFVRMYEMMKLDNSCHKASGKSSLQTYFQKLDNAAHVILVHNTFTKQKDLDFVKAIRSSNSVSYCICINANQYIEQAVPPVEMLRTNNCNIVIGTDSLASNWSLSIWDEIKTINKFFPNVPLQEQLGWATINGAKALQKDKQLGSFHKGKKPGVILLEGLDADDKDCVQLVKPKRLL
jgi:cytosine/adenosine deaminase-related metal-dependent hydrolase